MAAHVMYMCKCMRMCVPGVQSDAVCLQAFEVPYLYGAILHLYQTRSLERAQGLIGALARGARQVADLFLCNIEPHFALAWIQQRV